MRLKRERSKILLFYIVHLFSATIDRGRVIQITVTINTISQMCWLAWGAREEEEGGGGAYFHILHRGVIELLFIYCSFVDGTAEEVGVV